MSATCRSGAMLGLTWSLAKLRLNGVITYALGYGFTTALAVSFMWSARYRLRNSGVV